MRGFDILWWGGRSTLWLGDSTLIEMDGLSGSETPNLGCFVLHSSSLT